MLANSDDTQKACESSRVPSDVSGVAADTSTTPDTIARAISQRLRQRRKEMHLSQSALAHTSGVSLGSLKRFEQDSLISLESLIKLSVALGCEDSFTMLFSGEEAPSEDALAKEQQAQEKEQRRKAALKEMAAQTHQLLDKIVLLKSS